MEEQQGFKRALENAAIKVAWGIIVTTMALPNAWGWARQIDGILGPAIVLGILGIIAISPLLLGCALASDDLKKAHRIWRAFNSQPRR